jgi:hypothetical protein
MLSEAECLTLELRLQTHLPKLLEDLGASTNWVRSCKESKIGGITTELLVRLSLISIWSS